MTGLRFEARRAPRFRRIEGEFLEQEIEQLELVSLTYELRAAALWSAVGLPPLWVTSNGATHATLPKAVANHTHQSARRGEKTPSQTEFIDISSPNGDADNDTINGGQGADVIRGDSGADTIASRDGFVDNINCGVGIDKLTRDGNDSVKRCE